MAIDWKKIVEFLTTDTSKKKASTTTSSKTVTSLKNPQIIPTSESTSIEIPTEKVNLTESTTSKKLGFFMVLFIALNGILGGGLFWDPGAGMLTLGPASIFIWVILYLMATLIMVYVSELITTYPSSGGSYEYCKKAYGRFGSFFAGWTIWIAGNLGMALSVELAAEFFLPNASTFSFARIIFIVIWIVVLNYLAFRGVDAGTTMLVVFGIISVTIIILLTIPAFISVPGLLEGKLTSLYDPNLMTPFLRQEGWAILLYAGMALFFMTDSFFGYETLSYLANEVKEPKKLPKVLLTAVIVSGIIMILYVIGSLGTINYHDYVSSATPFAIQASTILGEKGHTLILFGTYLVIIGAAAGWPMTGSRLLQAMGKDKLFPPQLGVEHKKYKTPYKAVWFQVGATVFFWLLLLWGYKQHWNSPASIIYNIYLLWSLLIVALVVLAVPILRKKDPTAQRSFRAPFPLAGPIFIAIYILLIEAAWIYIQWSIAISTVKIAFSFLILGLPLYFLVEMTYNPTAILKANESLSYVVLLGEKIFFPYSIRNTLLKDMGDITGKKIFEYGCSLGTLTNKLAEKVGPNGKIYGADISLHKVKIAQERTKHHPHVQIIHHPHLDDLRLELPEKVDGVISFGMLSYMQNPHKILSSLANHVHPGGEIVFLDYDKFFYFIPNVPWMSSDKNLIDMFAKAGFDVQIERKNSLLWQYIIISGKKKEG